MRRSARRGALSHGRRRSRVRHESRRGRIHGIAVGRSDANGLTMVRARAAHPLGGDATTLYFGNMAATSVASCDSRPTRVYAVGEQRRPAATRVAFGRRRTAVGGVHRRPVGPALRVGAGLRCPRRKLVQLHRLMPNDRAVVAFGWAAGTFLSSDEETAGRSSKVRICTSTSTPESSRPPRLTTNIFFTSGATGASRWSTLPT